MFRTDKGTGDASENIALVGEDDKNLDRALWWRTGRDGLRDME